MQKYPYMPLSVFGTTGSAQARYGLYATLSSEHSLNRRHTTRASQQTVNIRLLRRPQVVCTLMICPCTCPHSTGRYADRHLSALQPGARGNPQRAIYLSEPDTISNFLPFFSSSTTAVRRGPTCELLLCVCNTYIQRPSASRNKSP